jgi:hypothetical protein
MAPSLLTGQSGKPERRASILTRFSAVALVPIGTAILSPGIMAQEVQRSVIVNASISEASTSPSKPARQGEIIAFSEGGLTVRVQGRSLAWLLREISHKVGLPITPAEDVGAQPVSVQLQELPLDEGLRQILKDHDAYFFYGVEGKGPASLKAVWVYRKGRGRGLEPVPPETWASTKEFEAMLADPDPAVRSRAVEALIERKGDKALARISHTGCSRW